MKVMLVLCVLMATAVLADDAKPFSVAYRDSTGADVLIVHGEVGVTIDPPERARYGLFRDAINFQSAQYVRLSTGNYAIRMRVLDDEGHAVVVQEPTSEQVLIYLHGKIADAPPAEIWGEVAPVTVDSVGNQAVAQLTAAINPIVHPRSTRLVLAPTGRSLPRGDGYFSDHWLFFPSVAYGVSDRVALWGGFSLIPGTPLSDQLFYFGTKIGLREFSSFNVAAGTLILTQEEFEDRLGVLYGVATFGGKNASFTLLLGYGFEGQDLTDRPLVVYGGEKRVGRRTFFVAEVLFYSDTPVVPFFGIKRYSEDGASNWIIGYPMLGYEIGFGGP